MTGRIISGLGIAIILAGWSWGMDMEAAKELTEMGQQQTSGSTSLAENEMAAAIELEGVAVPVPGELFAAIEKTGMPSWSAYFREPYSLATTNRAQMALILGGMIADGYVATSARDRQQVKNMGKEILNLARTLGVGQHILSRGNSITAFADLDVWEAIWEELEAIENEIKMALGMQQDQDLVVLMSVGAWLRGLNVGSSLAAREYSPERAMILRQPLLIVFMRNQLEKLSSRTKADELVQVVRSSLEELEPLVSFPPGQAPSREEVEVLEKMADNLVRRILPGKSGGEQ